MLQFHCSLANSSRVHNFIQYKIRRKLRSKRKIQLLSPATSEERIFSETAELKIEFPLQIKELSTAL